MNRNNKKKPLVTIITPTYNRANFLAKTIESVLNQDYPNIEYIVYDDGSTDETGSIVKKFGDKIIYRYHRNIGEVATVNEGLKVAKGEIIGVVNSDDPLLPHAIRDIVDIFVKNPKIIVAYPDWIKIDERGKEIERIMTPEYSYEYMLSAHDNITGPGTFFRKKVLTKIHGRDIQFKYVSDYDFWLRAGLIGDFVRIPHFLATSRVHPGQSTLKNRGFSMAMEHIRVLNKIFSAADFPVSLRKVKRTAYEKACEAARICRGDNPISKFAIFLICLYYSPFSTARNMLVFRLSKLRKLWYLILA